MIVGYSIWMIAFIQFVNNLGGSRRITGHGKVLFNSNNRCVECRPDHAIKTEGGKYHYALLKTEFTTQFQASYIQFGQLQISEVYVCVLYRTPFYFTTAGYSRIGGNLTFLLASASLNQSDLEPRVFQPTSSSLWVFYRLTYF
ncbi:Hypothetical_protein [Hexamita inflata]|uniref:Hypothetical_protein n=1 Tax=Hexamita inflata TaxID=28002 RepID=A0AA86THN1_9EUKA|nr:Hypothetical protein HINF_LOCUS5161 [Hexamita inflata]